MLSKKLSDDGFDLGTVVDSDLDFLKNHISGKDLGYVISLKKLLAIAFNELVLRKDGVILKRKQFDKNGDKVSAEGCDIIVQQIYSKMQSIEDKHTYLSQVIEEAQKAVNSSSGN